MRQLPAWIVLLTACGEAPPPPVPTDGAPAVDLQVDAFRDVGRDVQVRGENPRFAPADIEVVLPFGGPVEMAERRVSARSAQLDVVFNVDTTSSFSEEIGTLQSDLADRIVPQIESRVDDVAFGVSRFEDFPVEPFGSDLDVPFELLTAVTTSRSRLAAGVRRLGSLGNGGDAPESGFESLYQLATGEGFRLGSRTFIASNDGLGGAEFREDALHVIVHATDAPSHSPADYVSIPGTRGLLEASAALRELDAFVLGIVATEDARPDVEAIARATGAVIAAEDGVCRTGIGGTERPALENCPLVFDVGEDGAGLSDAIVTALIDLLDGVAFEEVHARVIGDSFGFVRAVRAADAFTEGVRPGVADLRPRDGVDDTFLGVRFGTELLFEIQLQNQTLRSEDYDQVLRFEIEIVGDGQVLDALSVRVTVPLMRRELDAGSEDAGVREDAAIGDAGIEDAGDGGVDDADVSEDGAIDSGPSDSGPDEGVSDGGDAAGKA